MSKIIIEAGGTGSTIAILNVGKPEVFEYLPLNGNMHSESYIDVYFNELKDKLPQVTELYFYGAGILGTGGDYIRKTIQRVFAVPFDFQTDLMGSCRALLGNGTGHVAILGTGANCCYYKNGKIVENRSGNGIILGDEGSGAFLGKLLMQDYLNGLVPDEFREKLNQEFGLSREYIINNVYHSESTSQWLGQFSRFIYLHKSHSYFKQLIAFNFKEFIRLILLNFENKIEAPIHFNGGVAFNYIEELDNELENAGLKMGKVVKKSIDGLVNYHLH